MTLTPLAMIGVHLVVALAMLVIVPLGLRLVDDPHLEPVRRFWLVGAVPGALAPWLDRGPLATGLAAVYLLFTLVLAGTAAARLARTRSLAPSEIAVLTALVTPFVAAVALVAERAAYPLFGFDADILTLTVPHFHFAGFAAALVAGLVCRAVPGRVARSAALTVPTGTALVFAGYFTGELVELAGAVVLTAGMWVVGLLTWRDLRPAAAERTTRVLLAVSAVVLVVTMVLALSWAVGQAFDLPHLSLSWMVATHGLANALGFGLCAILAWSRRHTTPREARQEATWTT